MQKLPDGRVNIVNGLGADLTTLWLRDEKGQLFKGENLKAGQTVALNPEKPATIVSGGVPLGGLYQGSWVAAHDAAFNTRESLLRPGSYLADLEDAPFIENGLGKTEKSRARQTIIGRFGPEDVK